MNMFKCNYRIISFVCLIQFCSCSQNRAVDDPNSAIHTEIEDTRDTLSSEPQFPIRMSPVSLIDSLKHRADSSEIHFHFNFQEEAKQPIDFFSGYLQYDEEKYGFQNPAYLQVFFAGKLIYEEQFTAYERHWMETVGTYQFSENIDFYKLIYGLEAHDYVVSQRLICINENEVQTIDEFDFMATMFAGKYSEFVFPSDSGGIENTLVVINKIEYRSDEGTDLVDTIYYEYNNSEFIKNQFEL